MKKAATAIALIAIIAVCGMVVFRNYEANNVDDGYRSARERAMIKKFDKDGDGELDKEERQAVQIARQESEERRKAAFVKKFDKDGDGKLSKEERRAAEEASAQRKMAIVKKFDKDGDGKLNDKEGRAARKSLDRGGRD